MSHKNLYEILGVRPDASQADIRSAYLKLAKQWHPDRNIGHEAEAERRFKEIAHAYEVLSNPELRAAYDASDVGDGQSTGFESTMDEADAFDLFISVLLDLAFELAENGADQITIYQALIDMGCPSGTAKTLAQKAHRLGGNGTANASRRESTKTNHATAQNDKNDYDLPTGDVEISLPNKSNSRESAAWLISFVILVAIVFVVSTANKLGISTVNEYAVDAAAVEVVDAAAAEAAVEVPDAAVEVVDDAALEVTESNGRQEIEPQEPTLNLAQPVPQYGLNESTLTQDEQLSLKLSCMNAQIQGPAEYNQCVQYQISKINPANRRTDQATLTQDEQLSLKLSCMNAQIQGPAEYNQCVQYQMSRMGR